jgi:hypothetical protein
VARLGFGDELTEVAEERPLQWPLPEAVHVRSTNGPADHVGLRLVESAEAGIADADLDEADDLLDGFVVELAPVIDHPLVLRERADGCLQLDGNVDSAEDVGQAAPAVAVVDEDGFVSGNECVDEERSSADRLASARVRHPKQVMDVRELLVEEVQSDELSCRSGEDAQRSARSLPRREQWQEVSGILGRARLLRS